MSNYKTFADVFDTGEYMARKQRMQYMKLQEEQLMLQKLQQEQQAQKAQAFQQYVSGQQRRATQMQQPMQQQPVMQAQPEQIQIDRGKQKLQPIMQAVQRNVSSPKANKLNTMVQNDPDMIATIRSMGYDNIEIGYDEVKQKAWQRYSKDWTRDELDKLSEQPGGQVLEGLPEGKYTIEIDPISKRIRPMLASGGGGTVDDKDLTETEIIFKAMKGDEDAIKWMDAKIAFERRKTGAKVGELTPEAITLMANQVLINPNYLSKFSARGPQRVKIINKMEEKIAKNGLLMPDVTMKRVKYNGAVKSYNVQKLGYDADQKIADEFYTDLKRLKPQIAAIRTNAPSLVNKSLKQIRKIAATPSLGQEAVFAQELDAVLSAFIRVSRDASASISEMSATSQEAVKKLVNTESPAFVLNQQVDMFERSMRQRMTARKTALDRQLREIRRSATFGKTPQLNKLKKKMIFNPVTGVIE